MSKIKIYFFAVVVSSAVQFSCSDKITNNYTGDIRFGENNEVPHTIVTDNPTATISYNEMANLQKGTIMKLRVNRNEYEVWEIAVVFDALYKEGAERLILCHVAGDFPVGAGDSGSPLLTADGRVAGILCYGYYGNSHDFIARAVEDVLAIASSGSSLSSSSSPFTAIQPVYVVSGYDAQAASRYPLLGSRLGKYTVQTDTPFAGRNNFTKIADNLALPGSSIAVMFITGDYINETAIGTMSYASNSSIFAFGHRYTSLLAAPTYLAGTKSFIKTITQSFKMAELSDQLIGSCVKDHVNGILIQRNVQPLVARVSTTCSIEGQSFFSYRHQISNTPSFTYDKSLAADLSCYLLYRELSVRQILRDSTEATCSVNIITDKETKNATFTIYDSYIDWRIYSFLEDSIRMAANTKELKDFNLSINLKY